MFEAIVYHVFGTLTFFFLVLPAAIMLLAYLIYIIAKIIQELRKK